MSTLSEGEREALLTGGMELAYANMHADWAQQALFDEVAIIIAARLAPIEALAAKWSSNRWRDTDTEYGDAATDVLEALGLPFHRLLAHATCTCGAQHDRRGTGESGFAWFDRHFAEAALTAVRANLPVVDGADGGGERG